MSADQETKPKSYTQRLKEFLEENKCPKKYLDLISQFAKAEAEKREQEREEGKAIMSWGKFKGKRIEDVYKLDPQYINWCLKNSQYLSPPQKDLMEHLVSQS